MTSHNPITGDKLQSKPATKEFRDNYDRIFGEKEEKCCGKCKPPKVLYELTYSNDVKIVKEFNTVEEAQWFIHNEGDHVVDFNKL
jgi:hypothetical protein